MDELRIIGINVLDRIKEAGRTQKVLSEFSNSIRTRWGFHELTDNACSRNGFIIIELFGDVSEWDLLEKELNGVGGISVQNMSFDLTAGN